MSFKALLTVHQKITKPEKKKLFSSAWNLLAPSSGTSNKVSYSNAISISMTHKVGGGPGGVKTKGVTSHQSSPLSGLIDFFKKTSNEHIAVELLIF